MGDASILGALARGIDEVYILLEDLPDERPADRTDPADREISLMAILALRADVAPYHQHPSAVESSRTDAAVRSRGHRMLFIGGGIYCD